MGLLFTALIYFQICFIDANLNKDNFEDFKIWAKDMKQKVKVL